MAKDKKGVELAVGDEVILRGTVVHAHPDLASIRISVPEGKYAPSITFDPGEVEKKNKEE